MELVSLTCFIGMIGIWFGYLYINDIHELGFLRTSISMIISVILFFLVVVPLIKLGYKLGGL